MSQEKQLLDRLKKAEQRIVDLYAKLDKVQSGTYSREIITLPVPSLNQNVTITVNALDTIVLFEDILTDDFSFFVNTGPNLNPGDRIYMMVKGTGIDINVGPNLNPVMCGDSENSIYAYGDMVCHEMIFDGSQFTGIDNC